MADPISGAARVRELWTLRRGEEARLALDELVGNFPAVPEVEIARGMIALGMRDNPAFLDIGWGSCFQDLDEAEAAFGHARELAPRSQEAVRGQAAVLRLRGEYRSACQLLDRSLDELGQHAGLLVERAFCESDQSSHADAAVFLRRALDIDPCTVDAQAALCLLLDNRLGNHEEALTLMKRGVARGPTIDEIAGWLFMNHVAHTGEPAERAAARQKARAAFESVLGTEPRRIGAICGLAWLDYDEHGLKAGLNRIDEALATDPFSPHLNYTRGRLLLDLRTPEDAARALECFRQVRGQAPYVIYCWSGLADAAMAVGDLVAANEVWQWMARRFPTNTTTYRVGSNLALKQNRPQAALDLADKALKAAPGRRDLVEQRAAVLLDIGYHAEASQPDDPLQQAAERWPGDVSLRWRLLLRAEAEGRLHQALGTCREIRMLDPVNQLARDKERELRRQIRRRPLYRMFGARIDEEAVLVAEPSADETQSLERYVPSDTRLVVSVRLRRLFWREARLSSVEKVVLDGRLLVASPKVISICCVVAASLFVWSLLTGESGFRLSAPAIVVLLLLGLMVGRITLTDHYRRRMLATEAEAALVRDLLKLLSTIEHEPAARRGAGEMARLIESIAHAQARVIRRAGAGDKTLSVFAGHRALGVAAATRDLKQLLVTWDSRTPQVLFRRAKRMLEATCRREWGRFTYRKPDLLPRQVRLRAWSAVRIVFMGGVVAIGVWLLLFSRQNPDGASATLAIVTGLVAAIAPVMVPLIEYVTRHGDRLRKASESDRPSYDESSRVRRY